jgi:CBS domain-containing protein
MMHYAGRPALRRPGHSSCARHDGFPAYAGRIRATAHVLDALRWHRSCEQNRRNFRSSAMTVKELMNTRVVTCAPEADLGLVVATMRERDCGFLPVVDTHGLVVGVITDRDVCLAAGFHQRPLGRLSAKEAMSHPVFSCFGDENVKAVLATMGIHHVRRLPVLSKSGHLEGVLSLDDIVLAPPRRGGPTAEEIVAALRDICARRKVETLGV